MTHKTLNISTHAAIKGRFYITKIHEASGVILEEREFDNLILDSGLDAMGQANITSGYGENKLQEALYLSTSTTAPSVTDTSMGGTVVGSSTTSPNFTQGYTLAGTSPYDVTFQKSARFAAGTAVGTWSMIGVGGSLGLFAKTRIKDGGGADSSITVLAGEILDVRYESRSTIDIAVTDLGNITVRGSSYNVKRRAYALNYSLHRRHAAACCASGTNQWASASAYSTTSGVLAFNATQTATAPFTGTGVTGTDSVTTSGAASAYTAGTYQRAMSWTFPTTAVTGQNTFQGISVKPNYGPHGYISFLFTPGIPKTNLDTFTFGCTFTWGRA